MADKCPHCGVSFKGDWTCATFTSGSSIIDDGSCRLSIDFTQCPDCNKAIVRLGRSFWVENNQGTFVNSNNKVFSYIYPKAITRPPIHPSVPSEFVADYNEACLVFADSPKASAALSRRCIQKIIRKHFGIEKSALDAEIQEVIKRGLLPPELLSDLDAVRQIGNFAAHPMKSEKSGEIFDVEIGEAEWSLEVLESIFESCFVRPFKSQEKKNTFNKKLSDAGKPALK